MDEAVDCFVAPLHYADSLSIPRTSGTSHRRPVPWNETCSAERKASRWAEKKMQETLHPNLWRLLGARAQYRKVLSNSRRESWRTYISSFINGNMPIDGVWQRSWKMKGKYKPQSCTEDWWVSQKPPWQSRTTLPTSSAVSQNDVNTCSYRQRLREKSRAIEFPSGDGKCYNILFDSRQMSCFPEDVKRHNSWPWWYLQCFVSCIVRVRTTY